MRSLLFRTAAVLGVVGLASSSHPAATRDIRASANAAPANRVHLEEGIRFSMARW